MLDAEWRRPGEPLPWLVSSLAPIAWIAHLLGAPTRVAIVCCIVGLVASVIVLRRLRATNDRSKQHAWFLAQTGVALSVVAGVLVAIGATF